MRIVILNTIMAALLLAVAGAVFVTGTGPITWFFGCSLMALAGACGALAVSSYRLRKR